jgi:hypothetical protein
MRGKNARECRTSLLSPKNSTHESLPLLPWWKKEVGACRSRFLGKLLRAISRFRHPDAQTPPSPLVEERGRGLQGQVFWEAPACHLPFQASGRPNSPFSPGGRKRSGLAGAGFLGSSCAPSPVSRHPDAQTPPSPLVEERGRGLRGQVFWEAPARHLPFPGIRTPKLPLLPLWEKEVGACGGRFFGKLLRAISRFQASGRPNSPFFSYGRKGFGLAGAGFLGSSCAPSPVSRHPDAQTPFFSCGRKGFGLAGAGFLGSSCAPSPVSRHPDAQTPFFSCGRKGFGLAGAGFLGSSCAPSPVSRHPDAQTPFFSCGRKGFGLAGAGFLGSSCAPSPVSRHPDAQTPPSPLVGEGGWGDEGQTGLRITSLFDGMLRNDRRVTFSDPAMTLFG